MPKLHRPAAHTTPSSASSPEQVARQQGLRALQHERFDEAIKLWSPIAAQHAEIRTALAEAYFRRALKGPGAEGLADVRQAATLEPTDQRYQYHLGMRLHLDGDYQAASTCYRSVIEHGGPHGAAFLLALAALERDPQADLAALPGSTADIRAALLPVQHLLTGRAVTPALAQANATGTALGFAPADVAALVLFWRGLSEIANANPQAATTLEDQRSLPRSRLVAIRRVYRGVAAAQAGDTAAALQLWQEVYESKLFTAALFSNLVAVLYGQLATCLDADDVVGAADLALQTIALPLNSSAFDELRVYALDRAAHAAAITGDWPRSTNLWEVARQIVAAATSLGSPRPLLRNLAISYEAQELWLEAAEAWRAMLRTKPRKKGAEAADGAVEMQWAAVRKRVIDCYQRAGRPDEAVTVFRQMIKAEPQDLDVRIQLADALLANNQEQAALNEIERAIAIDPDSADAQMRFAAIMNARGYFIDAERSLRTALNKHPTRADVRRQLALTLLMHAESNIAHGIDAASESLLLEGQALDPENYKFPLSLARAYFNLNRGDAARIQIARVLELAGDNLSVYLSVFQCWVIEQDVEQARAIVALAESVATIDADFYAQLGTMAISFATPPPSPVNPFLALQPNQKRAAPADTPLILLGRELIERALAIRPNDAQLYLPLITVLLSSRPDLALIYAERAVRHIPDDPNLLLMYGIALGLNERKREGKDQLRKAAALGRKQGNMELVEHANQMRQEIDSPFFFMAFQMQSLFGDSEIDPSEFF
jgi:pentatricopeptide repeat protein